MKNLKLLVALPAVAMLVGSMPNTADARTKSIVKWGAIGIGAAALGNYWQQQNRQQYYYQQPYYGGYYQQSSYPSYGYNYNYYQQPSYGYNYYGYGY